MFWSWKGSGRGKAQALKWLKKPPSLALNRQLKPNAPTLIILAWHLIIITNKYQLTSEILFTTIALQRLSQCHFAFKVTTHFQKHGIYFQNGVCPRKCNGQKVHVTCHKFHWCVQHRNNTTSLLRKFDSYLLQLFE